MKPDLPRLGVLLLALFALLLQGGSLPHQHPAAEPGLFNHDHDLSTLAIVAGALVPEGPEPTPRWIALTRPATRAPAPPALVSRRDADPRAPPPAESSSKS